MTLVAAITSVNRNTATTLFLIAAIVFFLAFLHFLRPLTHVESLSWALVAAALVIVSIGLMFT
jgi:hypothetical protein